MKKKITYAFEMNLKEGGKRIELIPLKIKNTDIQLSENGFAVPDNKIKSIKFVKDECGQGHFAIILKKNVKFNEPITIRYTQPT